MDINFYVNFHLNILLTLYLLGYVLILVSISKDIFPLFNSLTIYIFEFFLLSIILLWYPLIFIFGLLEDE